MFWLRANLRQDRLDRGDQRVWISMPVEFDRRAYSSQRCVFGSNRDCAVQDALGISVPAQTNIAISELLEDKPRFCGSSSMARSRFLVDSAHRPCRRSMKPANSNDKRFVRQTFLCQFEFLSSVVVIEISPVQMLGEGEMRFA